MIRVLVNGASGRMGRCAVPALEQASDLVLAGTAGRDADLGARIRETEAQVVVDLTVPGSVRANAETILEAGAHPVLGTSGLSEADREALSERCAALSRGALWIPNFAIGAVLMMHLAKLAARHLEARAIVEAHHEGKRDAPSGTALATAESLGSAASGRREPDEGGMEPRALGQRHHGIPVHSLRMPGVVAEQTVHFGGPGETLSIQHRVVSREAFMPGLLLACRRVGELRGFVVGLESLLFRAE